MGRVVIIAVVAVQCTGFHCNPVSAITGYFVTSLDDEHDRCEVLSAGDGCDEARNVTQMTMADMAWACWGDIRTMHGAWYEPRVSSNAGGRERGVGTSQKDTLNPFAALVFLSLVVTSMSRMYQNIY